MNNKTIEDFEKNFTTEEMQLFYKTCGLTKGELMKMSFDEFYEFFIDKAKKARKLEVTEDLVKRGILVAIKEGRNAGSFLLHPLEDRITKEEMDALLYNSPKDLAEYEEFILEFNRTHHKPCIQGNNK